MKLRADVLTLDAEQEIARIGGFLRSALKALGRRGLVVGVSGGVDSAVCTALAVRAIGAHRLFGLLMPERDSDPAGTARAKRFCEQLKVEHEIADIAPALESLGCYRRRDGAIRAIFPDYSSKWTSKIALARNVVERGGPAIFNLVVAPPKGPELSARMPADVHLRVVAATNMKQRTRKLLEYNAAESRNYAVMGTPNILEHSLGFFVRGGDGLSDLQPIAHLYKTQVYELARALDVPQEIWSQPPSTDTYSMSQTQEEFYFGVPLARMDLLLWAFTHQLSAEETASSLDLRPSLVSHIFEDIARKTRLSARLRQEPISLLLEEQG